MGALLRQTINSRCDATSCTGPFKRTGKAAAEYLDRRLGDARGVVMGDVDGDGDGRAERFWLRGPGDGNSRGPVYLDQGPPIDSAPRENAALELPYAHGRTGRTGRTGRIGHIGHINGDGYGDLVTGIAADESLGGARDAAHRGGEIEVVLYGSAQGITTTQRPKIFRRKRSSASPARTAMAASGSPVARPPARSSTAPTRGRASVEA